MLVLEVIGHKDGISEVRSGLGGATLASPGCLPHQMDLGHFGLQGPCPRYSSIPTLDNNSTKSRSYHQIDQSPLSLVILPTMENLVKSINVGQSEHGRLVGHDWG